MHIYRESGATTDVLARVNNNTTNITGVNYQPQLWAPITVTGAFLASLGGCFIRGMSLGLDISILESRSQGTMCVATILNIIMELISLCN